MVGRTSLPDWDVIVLGAGIYGIQAARTYLDVHPGARLVILESDSVVGGAWSSKRIYDAFWTQTPVGFAEFSDRAMAPPPIEDQYFGCFPAKYVTSYLESYVDNHVYEDKTIRDRILFNIRVQQIESVDNGWAVSCQGGEPGNLTTSKLIDATGLTSLPNIPTIRGQEEFQGLTIHHKEFGQSSILNNPKVQRIAVLGGAKSAADVAYASAKAGKEVHWIIRASGNGPAALFPPSAGGPWSSSTEPLHTSLMSALLPSPFGKPTILSRILHGTMLGRWFVAFIWKSADKQLRALAKYKRPEGLQNGFAKLEPDTPVFWENESSGVLQRPDYFSTIAQNVKVYRKDIEYLTPTAISLANKEDPQPKKILVDAIVYATGWKAANRLYSPSLALSLGLPIPLAEQENTTDRRLNELESSKDAAILSRFPILAHPPKYQYRAPQHSPFRLYKAIAPPSDAKKHSIVFLGKATTTNNFRTAEAQALWSVAYLDGNIPPLVCSSLPSSPSTTKAEIRAREEDVAETVAWCRRRYLNKGEMGTWFYFDILAYTDMLLAQVGVRSHLNGRGLMTACFAKDLAGVLDEYRSRFETMGS